MGRATARQPGTMKALDLAELRSQGVGWKKISREMGIGVGTLYRLVLEGSKTQEKVF